VFQPDGLLAHVLEGVYSASVVDSDVTIVFDFHARDHPPA